MQSPIYEVAYHGWAPSHVWTYKITYTGIISPGDYTIHLQRHGNAGGGNEISVPSPSQAAGFQLHSQDFSGGNVTVSSAERNDFLGFRPYNNATSSNTNRTSTQFLPSDFADYNDLQMIIVWGISNLNVDKGEIRINIQSLTHPNVRGSRQKYADGYLPNWVPSAAVQRRGRPIRSLQRDHPALLV